MPSRLKDGELFCSLLFACNVIPGESFFGSSLVIRGNRRISLMPSSQFGNCLSIFVELSRTLSQEHGKSECTFSCSIFHLQSALTLLEQATYRVTLSN